MPKHLLPALIAGLLASGLFLVVSSLGLGFIFLFLPTLPLFAAGLRGQSRLSLHAALVATALIAIMAGPLVALLFLLCLGLPAWHITRQSLLRKSGEWFPIGLIMTSLTLYACALVALVVALYAGEPGGLPQILSRMIHEALADTGDEYSEIIAMIASNWSFLLPAVIVWLWGLALYAHAWLAHRVLMRKNMPPRPDFAVCPFLIPGWMLSLLGICALASLIGSESMSFLGKSTLISLMLPYFFSGAATLQAASKKWPSRRFFIFFMYFSIFSLFWPALILSGIGLWKQIKHLSGGGSWSKN